MAPAAITLGGDPSVVAEAGARDPERVRIVAIEGREPTPAQLGHLTFWVPPYPPMDRAATRSALARMPRLTTVQLLTAGTEPWTELLRPDVTLCSGRGLHGASTAELAVSLLLAQLRSLPRFWRQQEAARWRHAPTEDLDAKRILVVGAGDIGARVGTLVAAFGAVPTLVGRLHRSGVRGLDELSGLLPNHDAVVLAVPATPETTGLVDRQFLAALPDGAVVVNVARGAIVVTDDLVAELRTGRLRAALDVTDPEPLPAQSPLWSCPNVIITPHVGGGTHGWIPRARRMVCEQVAAVLAGDPLRNVVPR